MQCEWICWLPPNWHVHMQGNIWWEPMSAMYVRFFFLTSSYFDLILLILNVVFYERDIFKENVCHPNMLFCVSV